MLERNNNKKKYTKWNYLNTTGPGTQKRLLPTSGFGPVAQQNTPIIRIASRWEREKNKSHHQNCFKMWEKENPCIAAFQERCTWHPIKQLHMNTTGPGTQQNTPTIRIASRYVGKWQSKHQNCFKMWENKKPRCEKKDNLPCMMWQER